MTTLLAQKQLARTQRAMKILLMAMLRTPKERVISQMVACSTYKVATMFRTIMISMQTLLAVALLIPIERTFKLLTGMEMAGLLVV